MELLYEFIKGLRNGNIEEGAETGLGGEKVLKYIELS